jgi:hypothetical protein
MNERLAQLNRRKFLKITGGLAAGSLLDLGGLAEAGKDEIEMGDDFDLYDFLIPRVEFGCGKRDANQKGAYQWNILPGGDKNLLEDLIGVVRCKVKLCPGVRNQIPINGEEKHFGAVVDFYDIGRLRKYPFTFMTASCGYEFDRYQKTNLKDYILSGGFLLMDDCVAYTIDECDCKKKYNGDYFYMSSCKLLEEVFGREALGDIGLEHEVFHNVYSLDEGLPYVQGNKKHRVKGVFINDRLAVILSPWDIHCGWTDREKKNSREAIQMGVNIIMYALTH